jgi:hypothetical protein
MAAIWSSSASPASAARKHIIVLSRPLLRIVLAAAFVTALYILIIGIHAMLNELLKKPIVVDILSSTLTTGSQVLLHTASKSIFPDTSQTYAMPFRDGRRWSNEDGEATVNPFPMDIEFLLHNPNLCRVSPDNQPVDWLIYFHSKPDNVEKRQLLRSSWASHDLFNVSIVRRVFMVGLPLNTPEEHRVYTALKDEHARHRDLVVGNFFDSYNNLTLKSIMALKWISTYCANAKQAVKADDDVFVNIVELTSLISSQPEQTSMIACQIFYGPILRDPYTCMKWCAGDTDFPGDPVYPLYCSGAAYVISGDIIKNLYQAALRTRFFYIDDVYTTGLLPLKLPHPVKYLEFKVEYDGDKTRIDYASYGAAEVFAVVTSEPGLYSYYFSRSLHKLLPEQVKTLSTAIKLKHNLH